MPTDPESLRLRLRLIGHHFLYAKIRYPHFRQLKNVDSYTFTTYADFLLGKDIYGFRADCNIGKVKWETLIAYEFQLRKHMIKSRKLAS